MKRRSASHTPPDSSDREFPFAAQIGSRLGLDGLEDFHKFERFIAEPLAVLDFRVDGKDESEPEVRLIRFLEYDPDLVQEVGNSFSTIGLAVIRPDGCRGLCELQPRVAVLVPTEPLEERRDISRELERPRLHFAAKANFLLLGHNSGSITKKRSAK